MTSVRTNEKWSLHNENPPRKNKNLDEKIIYFISTSVTVFASKPEQRLVSWKHLALNRIHLNLIIMIIINILIKMFILLSFANNEHFDYFAHI